MTPPLAPAAFAARLREEGARRYHDRHPYHVRMHEGRLTRAQLRQWVATDRRTRAKTSVPKGQGDRGDVR